MRERPILFSASMVRAILEGRKTQTRRVVKAAGYTTSTLASFRMMPEGDALLERWPKQERQMSNFGRCDRFKCPYGKPGDRLWVRESFQPLLADGVKWSDADYSTGEGYAVSYPATDGVKEFYDCRNDEAFCSRVTPSIFMPRWGSRILLQIADVRVQRLQEIREEDAVAEGIYDHDRRPHTIYTFNHLGPHEVAAKIAAGEAISFEDSAIEAFKGLWELVNGLGSWNANPWVWAITFRRVEAAERFA